MDIDVRRDRYDSIREQNTAVWDKVYLELIESRRFHGFNYLRQDPSENSVQVDILIDHWQAMPGMHHASSAPLTNYASLAEG